MLLIFLKTGDKYPVQRKSGGWYWLVLEQSVPVFSAQVSLVAISVQFFNVAYILDFVCPSHFSFRSLSVPSDSVYKMSVIQLRFVLHGIGLSNYLPKIQYAVLEYIVNKCMIIEHGTNTPPH